MRLRTRLEPLGHATSAAVVMLAFSAMSMGSPDDVVSRAMSVQRTLPQSSVVSRAVSVQRTLPRADVVSRAVSVRVPLADLAAATPVGPAGARAGTPVDVHWTVTNLWGVPAVGPWTDVVGLSLDQDPDSVDDDIVVWSGPSPASLAAGEQYAPPYELWLPTTIPAGQYWWYVRTDATDVVDEDGLEANNVAFSTQPVVIMPFNGVVLGTAHIDRFDRTYDGRHVIVENGVLTVDGSHTFLSLVLHDNATLTHSAGSPRGLELGVSALWITSDSSIDVSGRGYASGEGPGAPPIHAAGGASHGGFGWDTAGCANCPLPIAFPGYGSLLQPRTLGSGGKTAGSTDHAGGGAVRLAVAGVLDHRGSILSDGLPLTSSNEGGGGSGGSIWISAGELRGYGVVRARGGIGVAGGARGGGGAGGRIHLQYGQSSFSGPVTAHGRFGTWRGGAGTVVLEDTTLGLKALEVLNYDPAFDYRTATLDEGSQWGATTLPADLSGFASVRIGGGARIEAPRASFGLRITGPDTLIVEPSGALWGYRLGFEEQWGPGPAANPNSGGGHGGIGGGTPGEQGLPFDSPVLPLLAGCAMPDGFLDHRLGSGSVAVEVADSIQLDGLIQVDGEIAGGAGGAVALLAPRIEGTGILSARGGDAIHGQLCVTSFAPGGGGRIALHADDLSSWVGAADVSAGVMVPGWCSWSPAGDGTFHTESPLSMALPPLELIDGFEDFDELPVGSAPDPAAQDDSGSWGNAGAWGFPPTYHAFSGGDRIGQGMRIVDAQDFDPSANPGDHALALNADLPGMGETFGDIYVSGQWAESVAGRPGSILRVWGRVWVGPDVNGGGIFAVAHGRGGTHAVSAPIADMGPVIEWLADGRLVAWLDLTNRLEVLPSTPFMGWQRVLLDIDLEADTYDLWWGTGSSATRVAQDLPFVTPQERLDRFVIGQEDPCDAWWGDLGYNADSWCRPQLGFEGVAVPGTLGEPTVTLDLTNLRLTITSSTGVTTKGLLQLERTSSPSAGGQQAQPRSLVIPPAGTTLLWPFLPPINEVTPCSYLPLRVRVLVRDPGAPGGVAISRWLVLE